MFSERQGSQSCIQRGWAGAAVRARGEVCISHLRNGAGGLQGAPRRATGDCPGSRRPSCPGDEHSFMQHVVSRTHYMPGSSLVWRTAGNRGGRTPVLVGVRSSKGGPGFMGYEARSGVAVQVLQGGEPGGGLQHRGAHAVRSSLRALSSQSKRRAVPVPEFSSNSTAP